MTHDIRGSFFLFSFDFIVQLPIAVLNDMIDGQQFAMLTLELQRFRRIKHSKFSFFNTTVVSHCQLAQTY